MVKSLESTNIPRKRRVLGNAQESQHQEQNWVRVKSVKPIGKADVYNMEVDRHHNYAVNGGFIIHNCDAFRYFILKVLPPVDSEMNGIQLYKDY